MADCIILAYALIEEINSTVNSNLHPNVLKDLFVRSVLLSRELDLYVKALMRDADRKHEAAQILLLQSQLIRKLSRLNRGWARSVADRRLSA